MLVSTDDKRLFKVLHLTVGAPFEEVGYSCTGGGGEQQLCVYDQTVVAGSKRDIDARKSAEE